MARLKSWRRLRLGVQLAFFALVVYLAAQHHLAPAETAPSLHSLCPFGAIASIGTVISAGVLVPKLHPSNIVLGVALLASLIVVGPVFCGWVCPLGTLQDLLTRVKRKLRIKEVVVRGKAARVLGSLRFVVLGLVVAATFGTAKLVFAPYDPYHAIFSLNWLFEPGELLPITLVITGLALLLSLFVRRAWCRFLCPLGAFNSLFARFSLLRLKQSKSCNDCGVCRACCPLDSEPGGNPVSDPCVMCMDCTMACRREGVGLTGPLSVPRRAVSVAVTGNGAAKED
jgi:polyferredoxin